MTVAALVLGAGMGERYLRRRRGTEGRGERGSAGAAELPKALLPLAGKSLLRHALEALAGAPSISLLQPVLCARGMAAWRRERATPGAALPGLCEPVPGGETRRASVVLGLQALPDEVKWVAIHDAARPLLRSEDAERVVQEALRCGAAFPALPLHDTLHRVAGEQLVATAPREAYTLAQTPQVFRRDWLCEALHKAAAEAAARAGEAGEAGALTGAGPGEAGALTGAGAGEADGLTGAGAGEAAARAGGAGDAGESNGEGPGDAKAPQAGAACEGDEAGLLARFGYPVRPVAGDIGNLKITTPEDMQLAKALLRGREQEA